MVAWGKVESSWPAFGSVLLSGETAYASAEKTSDFEGGVAVVARDPATGETRWARAIAPGWRRINEVLSMCREGLARQCLRFNPKDGSQTVPDRRDYGSGCRAPFSLPAYSPAPPSSPWSAYPGHTARFGPAIRQIVLPTTATAVQSVLQHRRRCLQSSGHFHLSSPRGKEDVMALLLPTTQDICTTVSEELGLMGGAIREKFDDGRRLFLRAILPLAEEVRPKDVVEGGIAVKAGKKGIQVHPYVFRQVCRNGAIMPHQVDKARRIQRVDFAASSEAIQGVDRQLREAVRACSAAEVFSRAAGQIKSATGTIAQFNVLHLLSAWSVPETMQAQLRREIMRDFLQAHDRSTFGLMNAVTSVARDQEDPEVRWRLEELGGGVPAMNFPQAQPGGAAVELVFSEN
jgi:hypothetical protein